MIQIQNTNKKYGKDSVIKNVSLNIEKGKLTTFIGPNGAGKTTLLNMVGRLIPFDNGEIIIEGQKIQDWNQNELAKKIAILKQKNTMNARITVRELLAFGRFPHKKGKIGPKCRKLIRQSLKYLGLEELEHTYLSDLSGGQLQRAFIGMILCQDTEYILLDEPLNNLDMKYGVQIMNILRNLVDDLGRTVVIVLHDVNYAATYADNIIAFKNGEKFIDDSTDKVIQKGVIDELFDMDIEIIEHNNHRYCLYYEDKRNSFVKNTKKLNEFQKAIRS